jgi:hypothetical protein
LLELTAGMLDGIVEWYRIFEMYTRLSYDSVLVAEGEAERIGSG